MGLSKENSKLTYILHLKGLILTRSLFEIMQKTKKQKHVYALSDFVDLLLVSKTLPQSHKCKIFMNRSHCMQKIIIKRKWYSSTLHYSTVSNNQVITIKSP